MRSGAPDVRLRLTLAYDGTGFRGWARQPGERTVEGELRDGARERLRRRSTARRRRPHRHGRARARERRLGRGRRRPAARARGRGAERRAAGGRRRRRAPRRRRPASTRASRRARARTATGSGAGASARRSRCAARSGTRGRSTSSGSTRRAALLARRARLPRVHADRDAARVFVRVVEDARWHERGDALELRDHGRLVPAPHGAHARRHDARARARRASPTLLAGAPRAAAGSTAPPWGLYLVARRVLT